MKKPVTPILLAIICVALASCLKDKGTKGSQRLSASAILGRWSVVRDSSNTQFWGLWDGKSPDSSVYIGKPGDYYNFTSYGVMYSSIDNMKDTEYYKLSGDTVLFRYAMYDVNQKLDSAWRQGYIVNNFTGNTCTLYAFFLTPETASFSYIHLSR